MKFLCCIAEGRPREAAQDDQCSNGDEAPAYHAPSVPFGIESPLQRKRNGTFV